MPNIELETSKHFLERLFTLTRSNARLGSIYQEVSKFISAHDARLQEYQVCVEAALLALSEDSETSDKSKVNALKDLLLSVHTGHLENIFQAPGHEMEEDFVVS